MGESQWLKGRVGRIGRKSAFCSIRNDPPRSGIAPGLSDKLPGAVFCDDTLDPLVGIQQIADGGIVVQGIDDIGDVFAHVAADVPLPLEKLRGLVDQVGGEDAVDDPLFIGLVKLVQAVGEEAEGGKDENVSRLSLL